MTRSFNPHPMWSTYARKPTYVFISLKNARKLFIQAREIKQKWAQGETITGKFKKKTKKPIAVPNIFNNEF